LIECGVLNPCPASTFRRAVKARDDILEYLHDHQSRQSRYEYEEEDLNLSEGASSNAGNRCCSPPHHLASSQQLPSLYTPSQESPTMPYSRATNIYKSQIPKASLPTEPLSLFEFMFEWESTPALTNYEVPVHVQRQKKEGSTWLIDSITGRTLTFEGARERTLDIARGLHSSYGLGEDDTLVLFSGNEVSAGGAGEGGRVLIYPHRLIIRRRFGPRSGLALSSPLLILLMEHLNCRTS
jgi:hypothetical protein